MKSVSPKQLFIGFTKIGLSGFGGVLPWARRTVVEQNKWLTAHEFNAILGICQIVPGPNIMNLAVCIGSRFAGVKGAIAAVAGLMLGPISLVLVLAALYDRYGYLTAVQGVLRGISAVGVGLIAATGFKMMRDGFHYPLMFIVVAVTFVAATVFHLALGWVVLIALPLGLWLAWGKVKQP
ncbi:chromate transporter [Polynucleobacter sp. IMCC30063]|uniref:chromate transporter n=1 Tax=Polynucleobacter sp. IMCC30063 TaxID=2907298 RepID=UPI001F38CE2C|nr:chromate transporter [Polynucleobacter sp. IMCC30063]MCE7506323.1 chromate transporter [Polynucleobacter sp. IMCC30063]